MDLKPGKLHERVAVALWVPRTKSSASLPTTAITSKRTTKNNRYTLGLTSVSRPA